MTKARVPWSAIHIEIIWNQFPEQMSKNLYDESSGPQSFCQTSSAPPASFPEAKEAMTSEAKAAHNLAGVMAALTLCSAKRCIFSGKRPYFMVWASMFHGVGVPPDLPGTGRVCSSQTTRPSSCSQNIWGKSLQWPLKCETSWKRSEIDDFLLHRSSTFNESC